MDPLCIYHGGCDDGFAAALVIHLAKRGQVELHAGVYGTPPPDVKGRDVILVDFSYKRPVIEAMIAEADSLLMLDHHKSAMEDLGSLTLTTPARLEFNMEKSGAMMAFDDFIGRPDNDVELYNFIRYIQDRDLFTRRLPGIDEFTMALRSYPQNLDVWQDFIYDKGIDGMIKEGTPILRFFREQVEGIKKTAFKGSLVGSTFVVPIANCPMAFASEVAGELAEGHPFGISFYECERGFVYSLRSRGAQGADVSTVASFYGGGGHKNAAGFTSKNAVHSLYVGGPIER